MAWDDNYSALPTRSTSDANSFADVNQLQSNITVLKNATIDSSTKTGNYTVTDTDGISVFFLDGSSSTVTITLPTLADNQNRKITFIVIDDTNLCTVDGEGAETIETMSDIELPKTGDMITIVGESSEWKIIDEKITCELFLYTYAGYGSTDTKIMRFTNAKHNYGNMFSENHSTGYNSNAEGIEITINKAGKYAFSFSTRPNANSQLGFSINSSQLTTNIESVTTTDRLIMEFLTSTLVDATNYVGYLDKNDVIRVHSDGVASSGVSNRTYFVATYLGS